jgi:transcriptional regulator with XRE-family HTH domain
LRPVTIAFVSPQEARLRVATRIREICERKGVSIQDLAKRAGTARSYLYSVLDGAKSPTVDWLAKIAEALGVDIAELVSRPRAAKGSKG